MPAWAIGSARLERTVHIREVTGSNPVSPTTPTPAKEPAVSQRSLRIAIFGESYLPYLSGVTLATESLARGLRADGHDVLLVVPRPAGGSEPGTAGALGPDPRIAWLPSLQLPTPAPDGYRVPLPVPSGALRAAAAL